MIPTEYYRVIRREPALVCYWRLNDSSSSTRTLDRAGKYNINGIYNGSPILDVPLISPTSGETEELYPGSKLFGAENQNVEIPSAEPLKLTYNITIEMWIISLSSNQTCSLLSKMNSAHTFPSPYQLSLSSGKVVFSLGNGTNKTSITSASVIPLSTPVHIVATCFRKNSMKIFINGEESAIGLLGAQVAEDSEKPIYFGELGNNTSHFNGMLGEVALYENVIGKRKIKEHFSLGKQILFQKPYYNTYDPPSYS